MSLARPFAHLRVRSPYSILEGAIAIQETAALCQRYGMPAAGLTDTNSLAGALEFSETLAAAGIQPIMGCTLSVRLEPPRPGERAEPAGSIVLLAQSEAGYGRLMALASAAYLEIAGAEAPHLAIEQVLDETEGLICLSGGPEGALGRLIAQGREGPARGLWDRLRGAFGDRFYGELQRHGLPAELKGEDWLIERAYADGVALVATNEPYFPEPTFHNAHEALLCIAEGAYLDDDDRRSLTADHDFKSGEAMGALFADLPETLDNTIEIARRCAFRPTTRAPILPGYPTQDGRREIDELRAQAEAGLAARLASVDPVDARDVYQARLDHELSIIEAMGYPGYFLIVADFIQWAKRQNIPVGPGRGSGAGSLVAWALTITDLDPLRFGLLFERFLNPARVSMPDFDIDFCQERRGEVIRYVQDRYGPDRVAQIITFGTLQARAVVRDVGRVLKMSLGHVDRIAKMVPNNPAAPTTLAEALESEPRLQGARAESPDVARMLDIALQLEGLYRNASTHAAGVVIGDRPLSELVPLYRDPRAELPATQFNMKWVEPAGLVKFDFLGLKTLTVIARALDYVEAQTGARPDLEAMGFDDPDVYALLGSGAAIGVFQMESAGMRDTLKKVKPDSIEDIIALISLYRPGPMKNIDTFAACKFGEQTPDYLHPDLEPVLKETYGVIIYQEQVMRIAQILSGYSLGEADLLRRAMGKKKKEDMDAQRVRFVEGAVERGVTEAKAASIFDLVAEFAGYGFNKSHAAAYGVIAYRTAWLKARHPVAFMAALISLDISNTDKLAAFFQEARRSGVAVLPPDVNASQADFAVEAGAIRYGLGAIKTVSLTAMQALVAERARGGPFQNLFDFAERADPRLINKRTLENLARAGAFDSLEPDRAKVAANAERLLAIAQRAFQERESAQSSLFSAQPDAPAGPGLDPGPLKVPEPWDEGERLDQELAAVGFYLSGHPLEAVAETLAARQIVLFAELEERWREGISAARMAGVVRKRQEKRARASGERFAFIALSDPSGEFEVLAPAKTLASRRDLLEPGAAVIATVRMEDQDGELRLYLDNAEALDLTAAVPARAVRIRLADDAALEAVRARLARADARAQAEKGEVRLCLPLSAGREAEIRLPGRHAVDGPARAALKSEPGVLLVEAL